MRRVWKYFTFVFMVRKNSFYPALLVILWLVTVFIINPYGNFPINDDWQYARPVSYLINSGHYVSRDSYSPILIAQVYWGGLFCLPWGFSFNALRCSTLALSLTGIIIFYFLLLKSSKNPKLSFLGALLLMANPVYTTMSASFMTDVPFLTFLLISIYFFYCYMESRKWIYIIAGTFFAIIATLIRQFGVVIPIAFGIACIVKNRFQLIGWLKYLLPAIITGLALKGGVLWLKHIGAELQPYAGHTVQEFITKPANLYQHVLKYGSTTLIISGFFLFPLLLCTIGYIKNITKWQKAIAIFIVLLLLPLLIAWSLRAPLGNVLSTYGIGPLTLKGMDDLAFINPAFPFKLLILLQALGCVGAIILLINLVKTIADIIQAYRHAVFSNTSFLSLFMLLLCTGYALLLFIPDFFFDRYLIPFVPLFAIMIFAGMNGSVEIRKSMYITCCSIAIGMTLLSSAMVHDYLAWNRLRWQGADYLTKDLKISSHKIDGGYEFNGWTGSNYYTQVKGRSWWCEDDEYVVAFHNFDGYNIIKEYSYQNYIPYEIKKIYVLQRK